MNSKMKVALFLAGAAALFVSEMSFLVWADPVSRKEAAEKLEAQTAEDKSDQRPSNYTCLTDPMLGRACQVQGLNGAMLNGTWICVATGVDRKCLIDEAEFHRPKDGAAECQYSGNEVCDGIDNNCDGLFDETVDFYTDNQNCGLCGRACGNGQHCREGHCEWNQAPRMVDFNPLLPSR